MNLLSRAATTLLSLTISAFLTGCGSDVNDELSEIQSTGIDGIEFNGIWLSRCFEREVFMAAEEDQPDGYTQTSLTIDSSTRSYAQRTMVYTDSQCAIEDAENPISLRSSGEIDFRGLTTTNSGLDATIVRYISNSSSPDLTGLLYREGDILYRESRQSTLLEDTIPDELSLSNPWQLAN